MLALVLVAAFADVEKTHFFAAGAIENQIAHGFRQLLEGRVYVESILLREAADHLEVELVALVPAPDCAGGKRHVRKCHHAFWIEESDLANTVAARPGAHRLV